MTFQAVVPFSGFLGWNFLQRTQETQREAFDASPVRQRDIDYFRENIGSVTTADQLVNDRRLLTVALGAFGLDDDINNRAFIGKVLSEGTAENDALANRLTDRRYREFSAAFGFATGDLPATGSNGFADRVTSAYLERQFEVSVGDTNEDMRLALSFDRSAEELANRDVANDTAFFTMMGDQPMRRVFEVALGLPSSFGALDIERQLEEFQDRANRVFGIEDFSDLADEDLREEVVRRFLVLSDINANTSATSPGSVALTLLSQPVVPRVL